MGRFVIRALTFALMFIIAVTLTRLVSNTGQRAVAVHVVKVFENAPLIINSVPDIEFPSSLKQFEAPEVSITVFATFGADGKVGEVSPGSYFSYTVSVPTKPRYTQFPKAQPINRESMIRLESELVRVIADQIKGVSFSPRIVNGEPVPTDVTIEASFQLYDAHAPRSFVQSEGCNEINLSFLSEGVIWKGNTLAHQNEGCLTF